ncbi:aldehyde ferredoxin oxidoreductase family protein [Salinigranum sp. GCM10025319]|uniref:aldehyde ferredoxin oxidoreductase family protein n=1 Tax=Salinigranum sp. GCM10025319 TaxID=3252687 RepID=UPI0036225751
MNRRPTRVLRVDLDAGTATSEPIPEADRRRFLGGKGIGARYLYRDLEPGTDPLSPSNLLCFAVGPLSGLLPGEPRCAAITKSPLSGTFVDSYVGGTFAACLPDALGAHLAVLVEGRADEPSVLRLSDGEATLSTTDQWGATIPETDDALADEGATACIGPAGERLVRYATVGTDGGDHQAGRGGVGAVMGAKRLKAVIADGDAIDPDTLPEEAATVRERYADHYADSDTGQWVTAGGTVETLDFANEVGILPTRGWQDDRFEGADAVGIEAVRAAARAREADGDFRVTEGRLADSTDTADGDARDGDEAGDADVEARDTDGNETDDGHTTDETVPRGATTMVFGAGLGIDDFEAVAALGGRCDQLGLDVISAGNAVAWAIRAAEDGVLTPPTEASGADAVETDPAEPAETADTSYAIEFGDAAGVDSLLSAIARREGPLADALADGVDAAAARFGADDLVPTVKSMALPSYDPRGSLAMALAYATSDRGACHRRARPVVTEVFATDEWSNERRARTVAAEQDLRSVLWCLVADDFLGETLPDHGAALLATLGLDYTPAELRTVGERVWTLTRLFNVREGFARDDDTLPVAVQQASADAVREGIDPATFDDLLSTYYRVREWDDEGRPTRALLDRLDLLDVVASGDVPRADVEDTHDAVGR